MQLNSSPVNTATPDGQFLNIASLTSPISGTAAVVSTMIATASCATINSGTASMTYTTIGVGNDTQSYAGSATVTMTNVALGIATQLYIMSGVIAPTTLATVGCSFSILGSASASFFGGGVGVFLESLSLSSTLTAANSVSSIVESDVSGTIVLLPTSVAQTYITDISYTLTADIFANNAKIVYETINFTGTALLTNSVHASTIGASAITGAISYTLSPATVATPVITLPSTAAISPIDCLANVLGRFTTTVSAAINIAHMNVTASNAVGIIGAISVVMQTYGLAKEAFALANNGQLTSSATASTKGSSIVTGTSTISASMLATALAFVRAIGAASLQPSTTADTSTALGITGAANVLDNGRVDLIELLAYPATAGLTSIDSAIGETTITLTGAATTAATDQASAVAYPFIQGIATITDTATSTANDVTAITGAARVTGATTAAVSATTQPLTASVTFSLSAMARASTQLSAIISAQLASNRGQTVYVSLDLEGGSAIQVVAPVAAIGSMTMTGAANVWTTYNQYVSVTAGLSGAATLLVAAQALADAGVPIEAVAEIINDATTLPFALQLPDYGGTIVILGSTSWPTQGPLVPE